MTKALTFPAWFSGPKGESAIFQTAEEVPAGWTSGAEKQSADGKAAPAKAPTPKPTEPVVPPAKTPAPVKTGQPDLDAHGHPYDASLHAGTGSKTKAGLWRMKVGKNRPEPAPGYPLDL